MLLNTELQKGKKCFMVRKLYRDFLKLISESSEKYKIIYTWENSLVYNSPMTLQRNQCSESKRFFCLFTIK